MGERGFNAFRQSGVTSIQPTNLINKAKEQNCPIYNVVPIQNILGGETKIFFIIVIFIDIVSNVYERWLGSGLKWCLIISHTMCQHQTTPQ